MGDIDKAIAEFKRLGFKASLRYNKPGPRYVVGDYIVVSCRIDGDGQYKPLMRSLNVPLIREIAEKHSIRIKGRVYNDGAEKQTVDNKLYYYKRIRFAIF
jgi:hypothetical protein